MHYYIYSFQDYLEIKKNDEISFLDVQGLNIIEDYTNDKQENFAIIKEILTNCINITNISVRDVDEFYLTDEIQYLKKLKKLFLNVKKKLFISDKIGELSLIEWINIYTEDESFQLLTTIENLTNIDEFNITIPEFSIPSLKKWKTIKKISIQIVGFIEGFKELEIIANQLIMFI